MTIHTKTQITDAAVLALVNETPFAFLYTDVDGVPSARIMNVENITRSASGNVLIKGTDLARREGRTFRLDRIAQVAR
jgi:predicted DNA-binding transcriptional regulator YafY